MGLNKIQERHENYEIRKEMKEKTTTRRKEIGESETKENKKGAKSKRKTKFR